MPSTLRLETFGGLTLLQNGKTLPSQKRRLAFFALLAASSRGMQREKLIGLLWPDSTMDNARHSLEQLVYEIRRAHGDDILNGGSPLSVNSAVLTSDLQDFESAIAAQNYDLAVSMYRGAFLDGFSVPDASEFERWATIERLRLEKLAEGAFERLAENSEREGNSFGAVDWLRKRVALDPLSARGATLLMESLARTGDTTAALQHASVYERLVRQELGSDADPSVTQLAKQIRASAVTRTASKVRPTTVPADLTAEKIQISGSVLPVGPDRAKKPRWRRPALFAIAGLAAISAIFLSVKAARKAGHSEFQPEQLIAVLPFRVIARDSSIGYLGEGMSDLLSAYFTGEGGPRAVHPRAVISLWRRNDDDAADIDLPRRLSRKLGATEVVEGEILQGRNGEIRIDARLSRSDNRRMLTSQSVTGQADSIAMLGEKLAIALLAGRESAESRRLSQPLTASSSAIRAFLQGRSEIRHGQMAAARNDFERALDEDSTFGAAAIELALATGRLFQWATVTTDTIRRTRGVSLQGESGAEAARWQRAISLAMANTRKLSQRDRILLAALRGDYPRVTNAARVVANWEAAADSLSDLPDAQFWLGEALIRQGAALQLPDAGPRAEAAFQRALELDDAYAPAVEGMLELAAFNRDKNQIQRSLNRYLALDSGSGEAFYVQWHVAAAMGDSRKLKELRARFPSVPSQILARIRLVSQIDGPSTADADAANAIIVARASETASRQVALHFARQLALNKGHPSEALRIAQTKRQVDPNSDLQLGFAIRDALYFDGDQEAAVNAAGQFDRELAALGAPHAIDSRRTSYWRFSRALWRISHGDTTEVASDIAKLRAASTPRDAQSLVLYALLSDKIKSADATKSLARLDSVALLGFGPAPNFINLVSARLHENRGENAAALAANRRGRWYFPAEFLATYLREEGRLALKTGDSKGAARAWNHYLALRDNPEPPLRGQVEQIRHQLDSLQRRN